MKKTVALALILALLCALGCSPASALSAETPVTITFWHSASDVAGQRMDAYVADFNANNPYGITVKAVYQGQYADATTQLQTLLSAENYQDLPDILQTDATGKLPYYTSGRAYTADQLLQDCPEFEALLSDMLPAAVKNWSYNGTLLGLPFATSTTVLYYNADLLSAAGWDRAPETFEEICALGADMQTAGLTACAYRSIPNSPALTNWLGQIGSDLTDCENGTAGMARSLACLENGALDQFLQAWKSMYDCGALVNEAESSDAFLAGETALYTASTSHIRRLAAASAGSFTLGVAPYPRMSAEAAPGATVSGSCLVLFDSGDDLKMAAAREFLKYLISAEVQADYAANTGYLPAVRSAMESDTYKAATEAYPGYTAAFEQLQNTPETMRSLTVGPAADFYYTVQTDISDFLSESMTVDEALARLEEDLTGLLTVYARNNG